MNNGTNITGHRSYTYNSIGQLAGSSLPDNITYSYTYDAFGNLTGVDFGQGIVGGGYPQQYTYDTADLLTLVQEDNQTIMTMTYAQNGSWSRNLVAITDHLGSIMALMDNYDTYYSCSYDAWGNRTIGMESPWGIDRGFCGHEHIDEIGLINMNGRMYDPKLSRFLSPDPYIQAPTDPQNFNRYSYCLNNPLKYTDPDGEFFTALAAICCPALLPIGISMDIGWMSGAHKSSYYPNVSKFEGASKGVLSGALGGALSMVGGGTLVANVLWGATEGAITGAFDAAIWNEDVTESLFKGASYGAALALLSSQNLRNFIRGKGFYNNSRVFENFKNGKYIIPDDVDWQQACLDYFNFSGSFDPGSEIFIKHGEIPAITDPKSGNIYYHEYPFEDNFDRLHFIADHESFHQRNVLSGKYKGIKIDATMVAEEEWNAYLYNYKNQGLYLKHGFDIVERINSYGMSACKYEDVLFQEKWWYGIFKLPRR